MIEILHNDIKGVFIPMDEYNTVKECLVTYKEQAEKAINELKVVKSAVSEDSN